MEEKKRGRGRPRLDVPNGRCSRRQAVNIKGKASLQSCLFQIYRKHASGHRKTRK